MRNYGSCIQPYSDSYWTSLRYSYLSLKIQFNSYSPHAPKIPNSKCLGEFLVISDMLFTSLDISEGKMKHLVYAMNNCKYWMF